MHAKQQATPQMAGQETPENLPGSAAEPSPCHDGKTADAKSGSGAPPQGRHLSPAAQRALAEAEARRRAQAPGDGGAGSEQGEINGRGGLDPVRYGDWEVKGIASDF